jgi:hypothetical protein
LVGSGLAFGGSPSGSGGDRARPERGRLVTSSAATATASASAGTAPASTSPSAVRAAGRLDGRDAGYRPRLRAMISFWISVVPPKRTTAP